MLPSGAAGKAFIGETTRLLQIWTKESVLSNIALKAVMIMPALLLQKPKYNSKAREHTECLKRRLVEWENGQFDILMSECRAIQKNIKATGGGTAIFLVNFQKLFYLLALQNTLLTSPRTSQSELPKPSNDPKRVDPRR